MAQRRLADRLKRGRQRSEQPAEDSAAPDPQARAAVSADDPRAETDGTSTHTGGSERQGAAGGETAETDPALDQAAGPDPSILASDGYGDLSVVAEGDSPPPWLPSQDGTTAEEPKNWRDYDEAQRSSPLDEPLSAEQEQPTAFGVPVAPTSGLSQKAGVAAATVRAAPAGEAPAPRTPEQKATAEPTAADPPPPAPPPAETSTTPASAPVRPEESGTTEPAQQEAQAEGREPPAADKPLKRPTAADRLQRAASTKSSAPRPSLARGPGREELQPPGRRLRPANEGPVIAPQAMPPAPPPAAEPASQRPRRPVQPAKGHAPPAPAERGRKPRKSGETRKPAPGEISGGGTVVIDGALFPLTDWSPEAIGIPGARQFYKLGDRRVLELELDFGDYAVNLDLKGVVVERFDGRTEWLIDEPTRSQKNVLKALSAAALKGGNPFDALGSPAAAVGPGSRSTKRGRYRGLLPLAAIVSLPLNAAIIGLIVLVAVLGGRDTLSGNAVGGTGSDPVVRALHGAVSVPAVRMFSPVNARVTSIPVREGDRVEPGEALLFVRTSEEDPERVSLISPCRCVLEQVLVREGQPVREGQWVATLYGADVTPTVRALFAPDDAPQLGAQVTVRPTGVPSPIPGTVTSIAPVEGDRIGISDRVRALTPGAVVVDVTPSRPIPRALAGVPTFVELTRGPAPTQ